VAQQASVLEKTRLTSRAQGALALGLVLAVGTGVLVEDHRDGAFSFALWILSIVLVGLALPHDAPPQRRPDRGDLAAMALILGLSAFLRLHRLSDLPSGLWTDEVSTARNALNCATRPFLPFGLTPLRRENWVHTSNLYLYGCWLVLAVTGFTRLGVKLISVLPGVFAPVLLYGLARRFLSRAGAALAAGLLAASLWQVTLSRWGWDEVLVTTLAIPLFAALWDAAELGRRRSYWIAGVLGGVSLYAYLSSHLLVAAAATFLVGRALWLRRRSEWVGLGLFLLGLGLVALPISIHWIHDPETFLVRIRQLWYIGGPEGEWPRLLGRSILAHLLMFHVAGDVNPRHNVPGLPMLDPMAGSLFLFGLIVAAIRWRRTESQIALVWLGLGMLGGILSEPAEAPQAYRTGLVAPACYLLAGLGFEALWRLKVAQGRWSRALAPASATALVAVSSVVTFRLYFITRAHNPDCWGSVATGAWSEVAREAAERALSVGQVVLLDQSVEWPALELEVDRLDWRRASGRRVRWVEASRLRPTDLNGAVLLITPAAWAQLPAALRTLPSRPIRGPFGQGILIAVGAEPGALAALV
jgi:4-amino-4-deoxy-L-arabinose transferase-like glycosyltransferase